MINDSKKIYAKFIEIPRIIFKIHIFAFLYLFSTIIKYS